MRKSLTLTLAVALLAGCAQRSAPLSLHARADAPHQAAAAHITQRAHRVHLSRLGCVYLRERLGLTALGSPPPAAPGLSDAQPTPSASPRSTRIDAYIAAHTNCAHHLPRQHQVPTASARPAAPAYTPPRPGADWPAASAYYPAAALRLGIEGTALVRVCIGPHGHVLSASISRSSGSPILDRAAVGYAHATSGHWRPATRGGKQVSACARLPVQFSMLSF